MKAGTKPLCDTAPSKGEMGSPGMEVTGVRGTWGPSREQGWGGGRARVVLG